jgi:uncharacterized protein (DUF1499 family)
MKLLKWLLIILLIVTVIGVVLFFVLRWQVGRVSPMPDNLGVENGPFDKLSAGHLAPCPSSPNCVSSYETDAEHGMEAMEYDGETAVAQAEILAIIEAMPKSTLITNEPGYIHAEFRSPTMNFVDDVEFYFDEEAGLIQFRSASRLGYGDMGANRKRMEEIQAAYEG